jgi:dihydroorotate dehydrogenase electron transfer subunit
MKILNSEILSNERYGPGIYKMEIFAPYIVKNVRAGQFINLRCCPPDKRDPLLRRPFSVFDVEKKFNVFSILYKVRGKGTRYMSELKKGESANLAGPLGRPIEPLSLKSNILLIGGGMGIAPLNLISRIATDEGKAVSVLAGFKDSSLLMWERDLMRMGVKYRMFSEDGSWGQQGMVCDHILDEPKFLRDHEIFCCGPVEMLKVLQNELGREGIKATAILEEKMGCGIGVCNGCIIKVKKKDGIDYLRVCREGPAFELSEVIFD